MTIQSKLILLICCVIGENVSMFSSLLLRRLFELSLSGVRFEIWKKAWGYTIDTTSLILFFRYSFVHSTTLRNPKTNRQSCQMFRFIALLVLLVVCMQSVTAIAVINRTPSKFERRQVNGVWRNLPRAGGNGALPKSGFPIYPSSPT